ncbi:YOR238W [Saccharomyces arboricola H-6]|uniref:YOR238W n=1 Tax=Saccharomyces arboricola (strain H-6 / AS 2.3317 / CBS 10644) TaxID=1160507 RepID=J8PYU3_SACAR|nr:YOR238W [Saccharomyces arboricola H-6]
MSEREELILVPCHSIWKCSIQPNDGTINLGQFPDCWHLAPFQYEGKDHLAFIKHGLTAIKLLLQRVHRATVIFSGSQTKKKAGVMSEAQSYYFLCEKLIRYSMSNDIIAIPNFDDELHILLQDIKRMLIERSIDVKDLFYGDLITTEEFSLDSFDNLMFSIYRFEEVTGKFPQRITIIGFAFKMARFINYHAKAIDYPQSSINYIGIDPKPTNYSKTQLSKYYSDLVEMERKNALSLFSLDWYATRDALRTKKKSRNPFNRTAPYTQLNILFNSSMKIEDDKKYFEMNIKGKMPWSVPRQ